MSSRITNPPGHIARLYASGELHRVAASCSTDSVHELAGKLGMTFDALARGLSRVRERDSGVPTVQQLVYTARRSGTFSQATSANENAAQAKAPLFSSDDWEVEKTSKDLSAQIAAAAAALPPEPPPKLDPIERRRFERKIAELEAANEELLQKLANTRDLMDLEREAAEYRVKPIEFRERTSRLREGTPLVLISDCHVEETVTLESVNGLNEHNPDIAGARLARTFEGARWLNDHARQSHKVRDMVLCILGDTLTGTIHEDLSESNSMPMPEAVAFDEQALGDGIEHLLEDPELENLVVVCQGGNHGRLTKKMRVQTRNETNIETLIYLNLARRFRSEARVQFDLPRSAFTYFDVYGRTVRASHGDHLKFGGALGGLTNPINRAINGLNRQRRADLDVFGHWHWYFDTPTWIVNGSTIGFGPFSQWIHAGFERPQQAWTLLDSRRWRSLSAPIWCDESEQDEPKECAA